MRCGEIYMLDAELRWCHCLLISFNIGSAKELLSFMLSVYSQ